MTEENQNVEEASSDEGNCPTCGKAYKNSAIKPIIVGTVIGFLSGILFVALWFGIDAGMFHVMAVVHAISGAILGAFGGLIYYNATK